MAQHYTFSLFLSCFLSWFSCIIIGWKLMKTFIPHSVNHLHYDGHTVLPRRSHSQKLSSVSTYELSLQSLWTNRSFSSVNSLGLKGDMAASWKLGSTVTTSYHRLLLHSLLQHQHYHTNTPTFTNTAHHYITHGHYHTSTMPNYPQYHSFYH